MPQGSWYKAQANADGSQDDSIRGNSTDISQHAQQLKTTLREIHSLLGKHDFMDRRYLLSLAALHGPDGLNDALRTIDDRASKPWNMRAVAVATADAHIKDWDDNHAGPNSADYICAPCPPTQDSAHMIRDLRQMQTELKNGSNFCEHTLVLIVATSEMYGNMSDVTVVIEILEDPHYNHGYSDRQYLMSLLHSRPVIPALAAIWIRDKESKASARRSPIPTAPSTSNNSDNESDEVGSDHENVVEEPHTCMEDDIENTDVVDTSIAMTPTSTDNVDPSIAMASTSNEILVIPSNYGLNSSTSSDPTSSYLANPPNNTSRPYHTTGPDVRTSKKLGLEMEALEVDLPLRPPTKVAKKNGN